MIGETKSAKPDRKHSLSFRKLLRVSAMVLLAAWLLPLLVRVNFWRQEVGAALSAALHRPVHVGDIHLRVIGGLGFEVSNVSVEEDPAFGAEPFARAESLKARVAISSLWRGRMEFASIDLISPSFNVVRSAGGRWNLELFGSRLSAADVHPRSEGEDETTSWVLSRVRVEDGRINFKSGNQKKAYRIESLDLDLIPPASQRQPWRFRLEGMPTRTDLPFHPTSLFLASGEFGPLNSGLAKEIGVPFHVDWNAENAVVAELLTIMTGQDLGVHGQFSLHGHAAGTTSLFRISAEGEIDDLHRWDLHPASNASSMRAELAGIVDLSADTMELTSLTLPVGSGSVVVRGRMEDIFNAPRPRMEAEFLEVPLSSLAAIVPQFTRRIAPGVLAEGELQGRIWSDSFSGPLYGTMEVGPGSIQLSESSAPLRFSAFPVHLEGTAGHLGPVRAEPGSGRPLEISLQWDASKRFSVWQLRGERVSLPAVLRLASGFGWNSSMGELSQGDLALQLEIEAKPAAPPRITGWTQISDLVLVPRGVRQPLRIATARLQFQGTKLKIRSLAAELGPLAIIGTAAVEFPAGTGSGNAPGTATPKIEFALRSPRVDIAELAAVFESPRRTGYFLGFGGADSPEATALDSKLGPFWNSLQARGTVRADAAAYRGVSLENVEASVYLHDRQLEIPRFSAEQAGGSAWGTAAFYFAQDPLAFTLESHYSNLDLDKLTASSAQVRGGLSGNLSGVLHLAGSGRAGEEIFSQLNGSGNANGSRIILRDAHWAEALGISDASETRIASFTAIFQIGKGLIHIPEMKVIPAHRPRREGDPLPRPAAVWIRGEVGFDRRLDLMLQQDPDGVISHWAGTLAAPQLIRTIANASTANVNKPLDSSDASLAPK